MRVATFIVLTIAAIALGGYLHISNALLRNITSNR